MCSTIWIEFKSQTALNETETFRYMCVSCTRKFRAFFILFKSFHFDMWQITLTIHMLLFILVIFLPCESQTESDFILDEYS